MRRRRSPRAPRRLAEPGNTVHVFPDFGQEHDTDTHPPECWCAPELEHGLSEVSRPTLVVVHRAVN